MIKKEQTETIKIQNISFNFKIISDMISQSLTL